MTYKIKHKNPVKDYWKNAKTYKFDMDNGYEYLEVYAYSEKEAKLKAKRHEKWLEKRGFEDKVLLNTIKEVKY
jgi:hypothetical protein